MAKTYKDLISAINEKHTSAAAGSVGAVPSAAGEADFANAHGYPVKVGGPNDMAYPTDDADDAVNARKMKETDKHDNKVEGERAPISQGTSTLNDLSGFKGKQTPPRHGDSRQGDIKPVRGPSSVKGMNEDVGKELVKIAEGRNPGTIHFGDGDTSTVSPKTAKKMLEVHSKLSAENGKKFMQSISKNAIGFLKMMEFASKGRE